MSEELRADLDRAFRSLGELAELVTATVGAADQLGDPYLSRCGERFAQAIALSRSNFVPFRDRLLEVISSVQEEAGARAPDAD